MPPKQKPPEKGLSPQAQKIYDKLKEIRASTTVALKPSTILRDEIEGLDGTLQPFKLRYYQVQGAFHMMVLKRMILGDGTGLGKCVVGSTLLTTDRGVLRIDALCPEFPKDPETFYDLDQPTKVWTGSRLANVRRFFWGGRKSTVRVTSRNGYCLTGSLIHPVLVRSSTGEEAFKPLSELIQGDVLCLDRSDAPFPLSEPKIPEVPMLHPTAKVYSYPDHMNPGLATLLGFIVSEGNRVPFGVTVTQCNTLNPENHAEIRTLFQQVFGWHGNEKNKQHNVRIAVSSVGIKSYLKGCGIGEELSREKSVPWCVMQATKDSIRGFLSALIDAESSVGLGGVEFTSSSELLARQVQCLLLRFGVVAALRAKLVKGYDHTYWRLTFFGDAARIFQRQIGFRSARKIEQLAQELCKAPNPNKDLVPHAGALVAQLKARLFERVSVSGSNGNRKGSGIKQFGPSFESTLKHVITGKRDPSYQWLLKLLAICRAQGLEDTPEYASVQGIIGRWFYYDPVVKIEVGQEEVMDLEIDDPEHCFSANGFINHNTVESIAALAYLWEKEPNNKVLVIAPKSAIRQWAGEIERFTKGVRTLVAASPKVEKGQSPVEARQKIYEEWMNAPTGPNDPKAVLITTYATLVRDWYHDSFQPVLANGKPDPKQPVKPGLLDRISAVLGPNLVVIFDEATAFKSMKTKTWEVVRFLSDRSNRVYGLTATLLKNNLLEGWSIYKAIKPDLFGTKTKFHEDFCYIEMKSVARRQKIPMIIGYKNLDRFREIIDPYYLGRPKHEVSKELPILTTRELVCEISPAEEAKYQEALSGVLELGDGEIKDYEETKVLTSLIYCQQVVDSLSLLKFNEGADIVSGVAFDPEVHKIGALGAKEQGLLDLLTDELDGEKVIVYTRFASLVGRLQEVLKRSGIKSVCITGAESDKKRRENQQLFQDLKSDIRVIFITDAGSEAINLQAAAGLVFYDMPWSWGNYVQILGRMIRIGSPHQAVFAYHLIAERCGSKKEDKKTIDHHVLDMLRRKKSMIDKVLGEAAVGALKFENTGSPIRDLVKALKGSYG